MDGKLVAAGAGIRTAVPIGSGSGTGSSLPPGGSRPGSVRTVRCVLLPGFDLLSFSSAVQALGEGNALLGRNAHPVHLHSADQPGNYVTSNNGVRIAAPHPLPHCDPDDIVVLPGGEVYGDSKSIFTSWIRTVDRQQNVIIALSDAMRLLMAADVVRQRRFTIAPEILPALVQDYPHCQPTGRAFDMDRGLWSSAAPLGTLSLFLKLFEAEHGTLFRERVQERLGLPGPNRLDRTDLAAERHAVFGQDYHKWPRKVRSAVELMQAALDRDISVAELADRVGVTPRHLQRLFKATTGLGPNRLHFELRMQRARTLIRESGLSIGDVADAVGFSSHSYFTRRYRERFGCAPTDDRSSPGSSPVPEAAGSVSAPPPTSNR